MSLYGAYENPSDALNITYGYSRDRARGKQIQFGLIGNADGIPLYADVHDGNTSEKEWNRTDGFVYVADPAAMTQDTMNQVKAAKAYLVTRAPNHLKPFEQPRSKQAKKMARRTAVLKQVPRITGMMSDSSSSNPVRSINARVTCSRSM